LAIAVNTATSVFRAIAGRPGLSLLKRFINSAAICEASVAEPPLPKRISFFPSLKASAMTLETWIMLSIFSSKNCFFISRLSRTAFRMN